VLLALCWLISLTDGQLPGVLGGPQWPRLCPVTQVPLARSRLQAVPYRRYGVGLGTNTNTNTNTQLPIEVVQHLRATSSVYYF
jgi:hypothetical protein